MSTLMHLDSQIGGTNVVNALDSDATTAALSAKQGKELNTNKADRTEIASASDVFDVNHIGGYAVGDIVIHNNVINVCQVAQAQGSVHTPTNTAGDTYWKMSSVLDALKSSLANSGYKKIVVIYKTLTFVNGEALVNFESIGTTNYFIVSQPSGGLITLTYPDASRTASSFIVRVVHVDTNSRSINYSYSGEFSMRFALIVY